MSTYMMDSGHRWMRDCDECGGWHYVGETPEDEGAEEDWTCDTCAAHHAALATAEQERDAAVADNAALLAWIDEWGHATWCEREHDKALKCTAQCFAALVMHPHPGAALLEKHREERVAAVAHSIGLLGVLRHLARMSVADDMHEFVMQALATPTPIWVDQHHAELEAARYADDNVKAFTEAFCSTVEEAEARANAQKGGQHVPDHNDFAHVQPSTRGELRRWAKCGRAGLNGKVSGLLVRARNEGLEKAAERCDTRRTQLLDEAAANASDDVLATNCRYRAGESKVLAADSRALKEPEE